MPVTLRNINPLGEVEIPSLRLVVPAGGTFDVPDEYAEGFIHQTENYEVVLPAAPKTTTTED